MKDIEIRRVTVEDTDELQNVSRQTFNETFFAVNAEENMKLYLDNSFSSKKLTCEINNNESEFYFATIDKKIVGYLKLNYGRAQTELKEEHALEIERIYVLRDFQGKNVGRLLFEKALKIAEEKNADYIWLGVWENNLKALSFYRKNGFKEFDRHIFVLGKDIQTDIMMKLIIKNSSDRPVLI